MYPAIRYVGFFVLLVLVGAGCFFAGRRSRQASIDALVSENVRWAQIVVEIQNEAWKASQRQDDALTNDMKSLLIASAASEHATVDVIETFRRVASTSSGVKVLGEYGFFVKVGDIDFTTDHTPRERERWVQAVEYLSGHGYLRQHRIAQTPSNVNAYSLALTEKGFQAAADIARSGFPDN